MMMLLRLGFGVVAIVGFLMLVGEALINAGHPTHFPFVWLSGAIVISMAIAARGVRR